MNFKNFNDYCSKHPWVKKSYAKLRKDDFAIIEKFLDTEYQTKDDAASACNRLFIDKPRSKNWLCVLETLSCFITHSYH
jgi:hypothetical protein